MVEWKRPVSAPSFWSASIEAELLYTHRLSCYDATNTNKMDAKLLEIKLRNTLTVDSLTLNLTIY